MHPDKHSLAAAGLFYRKEGDICECFSCGIKLSQWKKTDTALDEHMKWSRDCIFLKIIGYEGKTSEDHKLSSEKTSRQECDFPFRW